MGWEKTYEKLEVIGEGTYGEVFACRHRVTGQAVAIKILKVDDEREGFPATSVREIKIQQELSHPCLVRLLECSICSRQPDLSCSPVSSNSASSPASSSSASRYPEVALIFEYMEHDLLGYVHKMGPLTEPTTPWPLGPRGERGPRVLRVCRWAGCSPVSSSMACDTSMRIMSCTEI